MARIKWKNLNHIAAYANVGKHMLSVRRIGSDLVNIRVLLVKGRTTQRVAGELRDLKDITLHGARRRAVTLFLRKVKK